MYYWIFFFFLSFFSFLHRNALLERFSFSTREKKKKESSTIFNLDGWFQARYLEIGANAGKRLEFLLYVGISTAAIELRKILVQMYEGRQRYHR